MPAIPSYSLPQISHMPPFIFFLLHILYVYLFFKIQPENHLNGNCLNPLVRRIPSACSKQNYRMCVSGWWWWINILYFFCWWLSTGLFVEAGPVWFLSYPSHGCPCLACVNSKGVACSESVLHTLDIAWIWIWKGRELVPSMQHHSLPREARMDLLRRIFAKRGGIQKVVITLQKTMSEDNNSYKLLSACLAFSKLSGNCELIW